LEDARELLGVFKLLLHQQMHLRLQAGPSEVALRDAVSLLEKCCAG